MLDAAEREPFRPCTSHRVRHLFLPPDHLAGMPPTITPYHRATACRRSAARRSIFTDHLNSCECAIMPGDEALQRCTLFPMRLAEGSVLLLRHLLSAFEHAYPACGLHQLPTAPVVESDRYNPQHPGFSRRAQATCSILHLRPLIGLISPDRSK